MDATVDPLNKGLGEMPGPLTAHEIIDLGWNLLNEDVALPVAVIYENRLRHNLDWMRRFISAYGVSLCPHGKTTMAPKLFHRQLEAGAWGITLATPHQALVAQAHGVKRVLMANQLVGGANTALVSRLLEDPEFEFFCVVDSASNVDALGEAFGAKGQTVNVLIEVGVDGGRTGIRNAKQAAALREALDRQRNQVALCGVELFEGVLHEEAAIRSFLGEAVNLAKTLDFDRSPFILSGAGSSWFDVVAEVFTSATFERPVEIVLRPGCYLTHDVGAYRASQQRMRSANPIVRDAGEGLLPALQVWAYVQSIPEPDLAVVGLGKRDAAFDSGLPDPNLHYRPGSAFPVEAPPHWEVTKMMDQHAMMRIVPGDDLQVGDMVAFDVCHPCLTFDKWRNLLVLDEGYRVIDVVPTYF